MKALEEPVIRKIQISKYLYELSASCYQNIENIESISAGIILLQDAVEIFLIALCIHKNIQLKDKEPFDGYFDKLRDNTNNEEMPFRNEMAKLNKQRVSIKHYGILPNIKECEDFLHLVMSFFIEASRKYLNVEFNSISLINLFADGNVKNILIEAENDLKKNKFRDCQISCRKALYLEYEQYYDIRLSNTTYNNLKNKIIATNMGISFEEYKNRRKRKIEENVEEPTDYIEINRDDINNSLLINGIQPSIFWNILNLTPSVYLYEENKEWAIKEEFGRELYNEENAEYCFRYAIDILLRKQEKERESKQIQKIIKALSPIKNYIRIYKKASLNSQIIFEVDDIPEVFKLFGLSKTTKGLDDERGYYEVGYEQDNINMYGYVCEEDVKEENEI